MTLFLHQLDLCAPLFLLVFVGWGLRKARFFTDEVGTALTGFTFRFLIPVLLFDMLSDLSKMPPVDFWAFSAPAWCFLWSGKSFIRNSLR